MSEVQENLDFSISYFINSPSNTKFEKLLFVSIGNPLV